jgi:hypothetical protein
MKVDLVHIVPVPVCNAFMTIASKGRGQSEPTIFDNFMLQKP